MNEYIKTEINSDGLRYKSRPTGSPFGPTGHAGAIMSCFKCGKHKPRTQGDGPQVLGHGAKQAQVVRVRARADAQTALELGIGQLFVAVQVGFFVLDLVVHHHARSG